MKIEEFKEDLSTKIRAKYALLVIETSEETRAIKLIQDAAKEKANVRTVLTWSVTEGLRYDDGKPVNGDGTAPSYDPIQALKEIEQFECPKQKSVYILKDYHKFTDNVIVQRKIRDLSVTLKNTLKTVIFLSPAFKIPDDLKKSVTITDLPLPDTTELKEILCEALAALKNSENGYKQQIKECDRSESGQKTAEKLKESLARTNKNRTNMENQYKEYGDRIISAGLGLTCTEFEDVLAKCFVGGSLDIRLILDEKKQIIKKSGILEYFDTAENAESIGGLKVLKSHINSVGKRFTKKARDFGIDPQRGLLLIGVPGSGKSLTAKAASNVLQLPLIRLDVGSLFGSLVGESETRTRKALDLVDAIAPCILWIDEIEKGMAFGDGNGDSGTSQRIFATILTWMEENQGVYVVATCNSHKSLKAELMSRFPKIFFVDVPSEKELPEIISIQLRKVGRDPALFDIPRIVKSATGFVGREIRNVIQEALGVAFDTDQQLTTDHIIAQFAATKPITVQKAADLKDMREWAAKNAINASEKSGVIPAPTTAGKSGNRFDGEMGLTNDELLKG